MENIFKNAEFGDKFESRDGQCAVYWWYNRHDEYNMPHWVIFENGGATHYRDDGFYNNPYDGKESDLDIIGKWEEPIDEKKLDKLYDEYRFSKGSPFSIEADFKAGYRKAKEEY